MVTNFLSRRLALGLIIGSVLGACGWFWWSANWRSDVDFLPRHSGAEWIVYPTGPQTKNSERLPMSTEFRRSFILDQVPVEATLRMAGLRDYSLSINGSTLAPPNTVGKNWKQPDLFVLSSQLRTGSNQISVTIFNSSGRPALGLRLESGPCALSSDESWQASYAGAAWRAARLATKPKVALAGSPTYGGEKPWDSLRQCCWRLLIFAGLSAGVYFFLGKVSNLSDALLVGALAVLWVALFANNLGPLPDLQGYDIDGHIDYIRYIQERHALPRANEGWEMYQPPLYYLLSATLLDLLGLSITQSSGIVALRVMGMSIGIAQFVLVWASLRLLFPGDRSQQRWGLALAAVLPPLLYLCQYVTNETLAAALASACIYLTLRILKQERASWKLYFALGVCLGAALLTKSTTVLLLPVIFGALTWRTVERRASQPVANGRSQIKGMAVALVLCGVLSSWHYVRASQLSGHPLTGLWNSAGLTWWQDEGYRTSAFYLRLGKALWHPWFSSMDSFGDGIYSTLWGDALLGGTGALPYRPPWNYDLMMIGYWLALVPMAIVLAGGIVALVEFVRRPSAEWFLLLAMGFLMAVAVVHFSIAVPYYCTVKAFYGLSALIPFCACGALGWQALTRRRGARIALCIVFGLWAINSYASFWISRSSVSSLLARAGYLLDEGRHDEASEMLKARLDQGERSVEVKSLFASVLAAAGRDREVAAQAKEVLREDPNDGLAHLALASVLARQQHWEEATLQGREAVRLMPGYAPAHEILAELLRRRELYEEVIGAAREGLAIAPFSAELRFYLGAGLLANAQPSEANSQLHLAFRLRPGWPEAHSAIGAIYARQRRLDSAVAEYSEAVQLNPTNEQTLITLGSILAMQGKLAEAVTRFSEAVRVHPRSSLAHCKLALALHAQGQTREAIEQYTEALQLEPQSTEALNNLAWIRASHPQAEFRNGPEAVRLAERACGQTDYKQPVLVGTLAAAYAEAGRFADATNAARKAIELATAVNEKEVAARNQELLEIYRAGHAYHESDKP